MYISLHHLYTSAAAVGKVIPDILLSGAWYIVNVNTVLPLGIDKVSNLLNKGKP